LGDSRWSPKVVALLAGVGMGVHGLLERKKEG
jgi:hypothetical protein